MVVEFIFEACVDGEVDHFAGVVLKIDQLFAVAAHGKGAVFVAVGEYGARSTPTTWTRTEVDDGFNDEVVAPFAGCVAFCERPQAQAVEAVGNVRTAYVAHCGQKVEAEGYEVRVVDAAGLCDALMADDEWDVDDFFVEAGLLIPIVCAVSVAVI